jgi:Protein of unknown function (DUF3105)
MAKKKRKPRNRSPADAPSSEQGAARAEAAPRGAPSRAGGADPARRARKEAARLARAAARKRQTRVSFARRTIAISTISLVALATFYFLERAASPRPISPQAIADAKAAGCTGVTQPSSNPTGGHLAEGQAYTYAQHPATSGLHDPTPLPTSPDIYTTPVIETQAVHFLEHAGVIIYYRAKPDPAALPADVIAALGKVADAQPNTLLAPYPDLPTGEALALTAWNRLQTCPATITAAQASSVANGFAHAFVCTAVAPEPKNSPDC